MNIELYEAQGCHLYITLNGEFEVYGGTTTQQFTVTRDGDKYLVTIPGQVRISRFDIFARRTSTGQEWLVESGKIMLKTRHSADRNDVVSCVEYHIVKELVESGETVDAGQMIVGIPGDSAYDVARANGYEGTEAEYTEMLTKVPEYADVASSAAADALASEQSAAISDGHATESAEEAKKSEDNAAQSASDANDYMTSAAEHATSASESASDASQSATEAESHKVDAENAKLEAEQAAQAAQNALAGAEQAKADSEIAMVEAQTAEANAKASSDKAATDKATAEQAKAAALDAQSTAEEQATIATAAAAAAQAPESIAAQAARPATMVLLKDELLRILGSSDAFVVDTDGQKIIVHTDRLEGEQLAAVEDMLGRFVPQFIEVAQYNHHIELSWRVADKYTGCKTVSDVKAVNAAYQSDLTADMAWLYPLPELQDGNSMFFGAKLVAWDSKLPNLTTALLMFYNTPLINFRSELPNLINGTNMFWDAKLTNWDIPLPNLTTGTGMFRNTQLSDWHIELPNLKYGDYMFTGTKFTSWNIPLPNLETGEQMFQGTQLSDWHIELQNLTNGNLMFLYTKLTNWDIPLPNLTNGRFMFWNTKLTRWTVQLPKLTNGDYMFRERPLVECNIALPCLTSGEWMFYSAKLNKVSALSILNSIPAYTSGSHPMTIGIHVDHKYDVDVNLALKKVDINYEPTVELPEEVTEGKGWTIALQWNGTPTSTASTMSMGSLIYAKVGEHELPDGTVERVLDWGHYVTDWEARGYEQFRSVEAAREYFGLPEEEMEE